MTRFIKLPNAIWSYRLSSGELQVYTALAAHSNRFGRCCVRHAVLANLCGISAVTVARAVQQLQRKGLLDISLRYNHQGQQIANRYVLTTLYGGFTRVPCEVWGCRLAKSVFKVYLYLLRCRTERLSEAVPSLSQMVSALHMSKRTIIDAVDKLSVLLLLHKEQYKRTRDNRLGHNRYRLISVAVRRCLIHILLRGQKERRTTLLPKVVRHTRKEMRVSIYRIAHAAIKVKNFFARWVFLLWNRQPFCKSDGTILIRQ